MNANPTAPGLAPASPVRTSAKHCVFATGGNWYALPAMAVQEITVAPPLVSIPHCPSIVIGMGHIRSQFVPILALDSLLVADAPPTADSQPASSTENRLIVLDLPHPWGIRIAEALGIAAMETLAIGGASAEDHLAGLVLATAMYEDRIVNVLDPTTLYRHAEAILQRHWSTVITAEEGSVALQGTNI